MRTTYFFPLFIVVCVFSLCFRLNTLFAQTTEPVPNKISGIEILNQKIAAQKKDSLFPSTGDTDVVFDLTETEQQTLSQLENNQNADYLATLYAEMRPKAAARILQQLDDHQTVLILSRLPASQSAAIIAQMPAKKAGSISLQLADYQTEQIK